MVWDKHRNPECSWQGLTRFSDCLLLKKKKKKTFAVYSHYPRMYKCIILVAITAIYGKRIRMRGKSTGQTEENLEF